MSGLKTLLAEPGRVLGPLRVRVDDPMATARARASLADGGGGPSDPDDVKRLQARIATAAQIGSLAELPKRDLRDGCRVFLLPPQPPGREQQVGPRLIGELERRARPPRSAMLALIDSYLDAFEPADPDVARLGGSLEEMRPTWPWRDGELWPLRAERFALFDTRTVPERLGRAVLASDATPSAVLAEAGLDTDARRLGGLARAAFIEACRATAAEPAASAEARQNRLLEWGLDAQERAVFPAAWPDLARALLSPWRSGEPTPTHKARLISLLERLGGGDPRMKPSGWRAVRETAGDAYAVLLRWLTRASVLQFFDIVDVTADPYMWRFRRAFWTSYLLAGHIDQAWVVFNRRGAELARSQMRRSGDTREEAFAEFRSTAKTGDHAALIMRIGDLVVVDWSHNGCWNIWRRTQGQTPSLFWRKYSELDLDHAPTRGAHIGSPNFSWQETVSRIIESETGLKTSPSEWKPRVR